MTAELVRGDPAAGEWAAPALRVHAETVSDVDDLLAVLPAGIADGDLLAWVRDGTGVVGWGNAVQAEFAGPDRLAAAAQWWSELAAAVDPVPDDPFAAEVEAVAAPIAFVSAAFADDSASSTLVRVPAVALVRRRGVTVLVRAAGPEQEFPPRPVFAVAPLPPTAGVPVFRDGRLDAPAWEGAVAALVARLRAGEARKVVLARQLTAVLPAPLDLRRPLRLLARDYPSCWVYAVDGLFGATPELLLRRTGASVASRVLAGTVRRGPDAGSSATALASSALASSAKDRDEHRLAAQSVAHVLRLRCRDVGLTGPTLLELPNVIHLATDLFATLAPVDTEPGALLSIAGQLHPTAAVGGTPRAAALTLLAAAEGFDRGRYGAPVGWIDAAGDGELGLALRCGQLDPADPRVVTLYAGAGIVEGSDPAAELAETDAKFLPVKGALAG